MTSADTPDNTSPTGTPAPDSETKAPEAKTPETKAPETKTPEAKAPEGKPVAAKTAQKPAPAVAAKAAAESAEEVARVEAEAVFAAAGRAFERVQLQGLEAMGEVSRGLQQAGTDINNALLDGAALGARHMTRLSSCRSLSDVLAAQQQGFEDALEATAAGMRGVQDLGAAMTSVMQRRMIEAQPR